MSYSKGMEMTTTTTTTLDEQPNYYSEQYHYRRYPARIAGGRPGQFCVWSRTVDRPNPNHVTWDPEIIAIVAHHDDAWHAERAEQDARPLVAVGDRIRLGDLVIEVPRRATDYVSHVPCTVVGEYVLRTETQP